MYLSPEDDFAYAYDGTLFELNHSTPVLPELGSLSPSPRDVHPTCIHYDIEWKLQLRTNKKSTTLAEITEENLTLAPSAYWEEKFLHVALAKMVESKLPDTKYEPDEATTLISTTKRGEKKLKLQANGLDLQ
ncbi:hypothetical protein S40285_04032 [Stachybotrys chlorohalonatus IBT 40285]|uniref:Uncharacterized protein n=1 Tax=Stachybotrys chlorohalonatus (strain IBT 40285) TaxID=1283841 RepID=A0A084R092_STAC4|nr:hypothetical protein S40285_04032 [Stachybotrys chlorohalonata IBT 40285]